MNKTSGTTSKTVVFFPIHQPSAREMLLTAKALVDQGGCAHFLVINEVVEQEIAHVGSWLERTNLFEEPPLQMRGGSMLLSLKTIIVKTWLGGLLHTLLGRKSLKQMVQTDLARLTKEYLVISQVLEKINPGAVGLVADRYSHYEPAVLKWCEVHGVPSFILPVAILAGPEDIPLLRTGEQFRASDYPDLVERFPQQRALNSIKGWDCFYYPPWRMLALHEFGTLSSQPWVVGGGLSTKVLVEGNNARDILLRHGCPEEKIAVTGMACHDAMHTAYIDRGALKHDIREEYGIAEGEKILIYSLPPYYVHDMMTKDEERADIDDVFSMIQELPVKCLVSLHPKQSRKDYEFLEKKYGVHILNQQLNHVLPAADVFLVGGLSSTLMWAILCAIPTFVKSAFDIKFRYYDKAGLDYFQSTIELRAKLDSLLSNETLYQEEVERLGEVAPYMGRFDGNCRQRIVNLMLAPIA